MPVSPATSLHGSPLQKPLEVVTVSPPPTEQRVRREANFAGPGEKKGRYHLPDRLECGSPVGYRTRVPLSRDEASVALRLLSLERPVRFVTPTARVTERALFEESSLGVLSARQSTNYRGHQQVALGPSASVDLARLLRDLSGREGPVLDGATHTLVILSRPYRTPFTFLLTFIGHRPVKSLATVPLRALRKKFLHEDDIPTVGYLQHLHIGVLADAMERASVIASGGRRMANVFMAPFAGTHRRDNRALIRRIEQRVGLTSAERREGWRVAVVAQVGEVPSEDRIEAPDDTWRRLGANLLAFRSERIQPGVNMEEKAPSQYHQRQDMDVPDELTVQCGRAAYNAFCHWTTCDRERAKDLMLLERIDVLTPNGKERMREVRDMLGAVTDEVMKGMPLWADLPLGRALSRNAGRGKKAFALAGQRIYIGGLSRREVELERIDWDSAVRAFGAASSRSALVAEIAGVTDLPDDCDLLAGICLMAGPVNQNDIGKAFFRHDDLLEQAFPGREPTSLLVWTLKAKTIADPIGNEEQLMDAARKGALVDLRPAPHEVCSLDNGGTIRPWREADGRTSRERAFADVGNFVTAPDGQAIPGNEGEPFAGTDPDAPVWAL
ncbi:MAG: hypothetical protein EA398_02610 [Deltaproteobacteria bacterium]|nr:MAG: hypothetical protein EA398_02610 [Deltaproteobacteria bacterium]